MIIGWIIFALVVGFIGADRKIGFWGAFLLSLLLSPIIGLIITVISKSKSSLRAESQNQRTSNYNNYLSTRNSNPDAFTFPELTGSEQYVSVSPESIPNILIGQPISLKKYSKNGFNKEGKGVCKVQVGGKILEYKMPFDGSVRHIHQPNTFLMLGDPLFIVNQKNS